MSTIATRPRPIGPALEIGPHSIGILLTKEEFTTAHREDGWRYELINGVLIVSPVPLRQERGPNEYLGHLLIVYQESPEGTTLDGTLAEEEIDTGKNIRKVDRAIWTGLGHPPTEGDIPSVNVEFVSKGKRNFLRGYLDKRDEYLAMGVKEYWVINRFDQTMTVNTKVRRRIREQIFHATDVYRTSLLPGFELPLAKLFDVAEYWKQ
jgi:Uma2 family endonuclease